MEPFGLALAYLTAHFLAYAVVGRHFRSLLSERGIFLFHLVSACLAVAVAGACAVAWMPDHALAVVVGVAALHGIYSLSFLELWSLSQISYSRDVIEAVLAGRRSREEVIAALANVGDAKKRTRLQGLSSLGLLSAHATDGTVGLRAPGVLLSSGLRFLRWVTNLRSTG